MPNTIRQGFDALKSNLEITTLQGSTVSKRQQNVRYNIAKEMTVIEDFLAGSYQRSTMIAPLKSSDVDVFIVLDPKHYSRTANAPANLLDSVKRVLKKSYSESTDISRNGQAATIVFSEFKLDVVPAFQRQGGGYMIPDSIQNRWISTDPKQHIAHWSYRNNAHVGKLIPVLKMLKGWNRSHSEKLRSFHLEALAVKIFEYRLMGEDWESVRYFFETAPGIVSSVRDPASYGGDLGDYLDFKEQKEVIVRLQMAHTQAQDAIKLQSVGRTGPAYSKWRTIFGDYFPAFG